LCPPNNLAAYSHLGRGTIVIEHFAEPDDFVSLTSASFEPFRSRGRMLANSHGSLKETECTHY
jgi:hypothetical protein